MRITSCNDSYSVLTKLAHAQNRLDFIFNYFIYHSTDYDKQGLAAYKSFADYRLFEKGNVESLLAKTLVKERIHLYDGKVCPTMKEKTNDGMTLTLVFNNNNVFATFISSARFQMMVVERGSINNDSMTDFT